MNLDKPLVREAGGGHDALPPQVGRPRGSAARELADSLGVSEACALGYITLLASAGRLRIETVALPRPAAGHGAAGAPLAHAA
jgi:hypothetical protein